LKTSAVERAFSPDITPLAAIVSTSGLLAPVTTTRPDVSTAGSVPADALEESIVAFVAPLRSVARESGHRDRTGHGADLGLVEARDLDRAGIRDHSGIVGDRGCLEDVEARHVHRCGGSDRRVGRDDADRERPDGTTARFGHVEVFEERIEGRPLFVRRVAVGTPDPDVALRDHHT
jgi:hypothetical protein